MSAPNKISYYRLAWRQLLASLRALALPAKARQDVRVAPGEPSAPPAPIGKNPPERAQEDAVSEAILELKLGLYRTLEPMLTQLPLARHAHAAGQPLEASDVLALYGPLDAALQELGITAIGEVGQGLPFDPTCHQVKDASLLPGTPIKVKQPGYRLGERLLRRARVVVS